MEQKQCKLEENINSGRWFKKGMDLVENHAFNGSMWDKKTYARLCDHCGLKITVRELQDNSQPFPSEEVKAEKNDY